MEELIKDFEEYLKEYYTSENTIESYLSDIKIFLKHFLNYYGEELTSFSRGHIMEYKKYLLEQKGYKFSTINRKLASLSIYENFLIEKGIKKEKSIRDKDFYKIDIPFINADMLPRKAIKKVILKASENKLRDYLILILMNNGGLRVSEVIRIELERDVDFEMRRIVILGKGNKIRYIFMDEIILDALNEYLPERERMLNGRENKYLIVSNMSVNTGKPIHRSSVNKLLSSYCEQINENMINPHKLRHNYATDKYQEGYNDMMLKKSLGQTSNATNRYVHEGYETEIAKRNKERNSN